MYKTAAILDKKILFSPAIPTEKRPIQKISGGINETNQRKFKTFLLVLIFIIQ